jgi:hypothetical protein
MGTPDVDSIDQQGGGAGGSSRSALRRLGLPAAVLGLALGTAQLAAAAPSLAAGSATSAARVAVGDAPALPKGAVSAAAPSASTKLSLDLQLNTGHASELEAYASAVGNRNSPYYHQYLKPSQIAEYFGASSSEVASVGSALAAQGLTVGQVSSNGMFLPVSGSVAQAEKAFGVTIAGYQDAGRHFYANTSAPSVSASISGELSAVVGLDDVTYAVPQYVSSGHVEKAPATRPTANAIAQDQVGTCANINSVYAGSGASEGDGYYTADEVSDAYGLTPVLTGGDDGSGVTVAVFELENYDATGVADLDSCYGHSSTPVSEVKVDGGPSSTEPANMFDNVGIESALDIENIANLAPGASIIDYAGPNADVASETDILNTYETIFNQDKANVVSSSWGLCEVVTEASDSAMMGEENALFEQAAAQGQTVLAASGDNGSTACYNQGIPADNSVLSVADPASQPFVTGVGGTGMTGTTTFPETTWNDCNADYCGASVGGVSNYWSAPSYQSGVAGSGYTKECAAHAGAGCRQVPDVSALADTADGYVIEEIYNDGSGDDGESYNVIGGTSGAAPVWAAIVALADASSTCQANGGAGFLNPNLYTAGEGSASSSTFTDITTGNNGIGQYDAPYAYAATAGYDLATGWGAPDAAGVISAVCAGSITSPDAYYVPNGPARLLDTRKGTGGTTGPIASHASVKLQITGVQGVPTTNVSAVVLNITAVSPSANGDATVYPDGGSVPLASNLNWRAGETEPNLVVVPVGSDGKIAIWNGSSGNVQFLADEAGYFTTSSAGGVSTYTAVGPVRAMDTRHGTGGVPLAKIPGGGAVSLQVGGATFGTGADQVTIPSGITAVAMNVTTVDTAGNGDLTVYPDETSSGTSIPVPIVSNLNFTTGQTVANMVIVPVGADGVVGFYNGGGSSGSTDAIADIAGYFSSGTGGAKYHAIGPARLLDTRSGLGEDLDTGKAISSEGTLTLPLPSSYSAVVANLTVVSPSSNGFLSGYAAGGTLPLVSNVNFRTGQTIPNLAIVPSDSGASFYYSGTGTTQLLVDMAGYFSAK